MPASRNNMLRVWSSYCPEQIKMPNNLMKIVNITLGFITLLCTLGASGQPVYAYAQAETDFASSPPDKPVLVSPPFQAGQRTLTPTLTIKAPSPGKDLLTVTFYGRPVFDPENAKDFNVVVLPDTQKYSVGEDGGKAEIFYSQTKWAADNQIGMNIAYVSQVGDLTDNGDNGSQNEWLVAKYAMENLEIPLPGKPDGIPYGVAAGNHDQFKGTELFNKYFGIKKFDGRSYYGGHFGEDNNNHFELFSAGGLDFMVINLEYSPSAEVLVWASDQLKNYPLRRAIVVSHEILDADQDGEYSGVGMNIYKALKGNPNLFLMLCGHYFGASRRKDIDPVTGKTVYTLLADYQNLAAGGNGYLRVLNFSPARNQISVMTYSPYLGKWDNAAQNQFVLKYKMTDNPFQVIGSVSGVEPGSNVSTSWPNLAENRQYEWYATVSNEAGTTKGSAWRFTTDNKPLANPDKYSMEWNTTLKIDPKGLLANDYYRGKGRMQAILVKAPAHGKLELNPDGSFIYISDVGYFGVDRFVYFVSSGVLSSRNVNVDIDILARMDIYPN